MIDLYYWPMPNMIPVNIGQGAQFTPAVLKISHCVSYAPQDGNEYARDRYANEYNRCSGVLERRHPPPPPRQRLMRNFQPV